MGKRIIKQGAGSCGEREISHKRILAVDPGTQWCGWAFYADGKLEDSGTIQASGDPMDRCEAIAREIFYEASLRQPDAVVCEKPLKRGKGAASGHIHILVHFCGMVHGILSQHSVPFKFIEVISWKGALPKSIHQPRVIREIKEKYDIDIADKSEDAIDAIGLGLYAIKNFHLFSEQP